MRTFEEFQEGHIEKAINMPLDTLESKLSSIESFKDKKVLLYCKSGFRSSQAVEILMNNGFEHIYHFVEGYDKWKEVYVD